MRGRYVRIARTMRRLQWLYSRHQVGLERVRASVVSWLAHAEHASAQGLCRRLLAAFPFVRGQ